MIFWVPVMIRQLNSNLTTKAVAVNLIIQENLW